MKPVPPRSILRVRQQPHMDPSRKGETIVEVLRGDDVVACIYGTREGVQVMALHKKEVSPFCLEVMSTPPSVVVPLLKDGEECPWCNGSKVFSERKCPVCR